MAELSQGSVVLDGRFRIVRRLASGGMGDVYAAEQLSLGRVVALKVLRDDLRAVPGMEERFRREAQILSAIDHPSVVRVIDFGQSSEGPYLVMEYVGGETLEQRLASGPLPVDEALDLLQQLSEGLSAIHAQGVVHRDLKPENVVLTGTNHGGHRRARLLDFGIARVAEEVPGQAALTQVGLVLGTPEYVSPEQAMGQPLDARSDVYSFAVLAFRALAGRPLFPGPSASELLSQHLTQLPPTLESVRPEVARCAGLSELLHRCLAKDRALRPEDGAALHAVLRGLHAEPITEPEPLPLETLALEPATIIADPTSESAESRVPPVAPASPPTMVLTAPEPGSSPGRSSTTQLTPRSTSVWELGAVGRSQNLTLLLTDLQGFTERTSQQTLEENARMLEAHDRLLVPILKSFKGKLVQKRGDALLAIFRSPTDAVRCGMAMQDALFARNQLVPDDHTLRVRVALHQGEVVQAASGLVGEPASVINEVERVANAGDVVLTEAVRLSMNRAAAELEAQDSLQVAGTELRLYRCKPNPVGPPFGGRVMPPEATPALLSLGERLWRTVTTNWPEVPAFGRRAWVRVEDGAWQLKVRARNASPSTRRVAAGLGLAVLVASGGFTATLLSAEARVDRLLEKGDARAALEMIQAQPTETQETSSLKTRRARALHLLKRHDEEHAVLAGVDAAALELPVLDALAEDFGRTASDSSRDLLRTALARRASELETLAKREELSMARWGALRFLDREDKAQSLALATLYAQSLESENCTVRAIAAGRLTQLKATDALHALQRLADSPKKKVRSGVFDDGECGHDAARLAAQRLMKLQDR